MVKCPGDIADCDDCEFSRTVSWCAQQYEKPREVGKDYKYYMEGFWAGYKNAHEEYEILEKALHESDWIPIDKEPPPEQENVIVSIYNDSGDIPFKYTTAGWRVGSVWIVENEVNPYVVAWKYFPESY